jgi:hypothetical protein
MHFHHEDITKRTIDVGDILIYVGLGKYGSAISSLCFGQVVGLTKSSVKVQPVDETGKPLQRNEGHAVPNGTFYKGYGGMQVEQTDWVVTGQVDVEPVSIKNTGDRYYILKKV